VRQRVGGWLASFFPAFLLTQLTRPHNPTHTADESDMSYRAAAKIAASWECNLLVVASAHLVLCQVGVTLAVLVLASANTCPLC